MKYVMQQNTSLNTTRNILSTFPAHKKHFRHWKQESCRLLPNKNMTVSPSDQTKPREMKSNAAAQTVDTKGSISPTVGQFYKVRYSFLHGKGQKQGVKQKMMIVTIFRTIGNLWLMEQL